MKILFFGSYYPRVRTPKPLNDIAEGKKEGKGGKKPPKKRKPRKTKEREMDSTRKIPNKEFMSRAEGSKSMKKDHGLKRWTELKAINRLTNSVRNYTIYEAGKWLQTWVLVKLIEKPILHFGFEDPKDTKLKRFESDTQQIYQNEEGLKYRTKFEIDHGVPNKYMRQSKIANGTKAIWFPEFVPLQATRGQDIINYTGRCYAQAGANRQGFATWGLATKNPIDPTPALADYLTPRAAFPETAINPSYFYKYFGLASNGMIANYFGDNGLSDNVRNFLNSSEFKKDLMVDLYTNICSRFSIHTYYNAMKITDVNIKLYICRYKKKGGTERNIWESICAWGNQSAINTGYGIPQTAATKDVQDAAWLGENQNLNWFDPQVEDISFALPNPDPTVSTSERRIVEVSSVLGLTPQQSQKFNKSWEVLDVIDNKLSPNDCWEFHIEEKYHKGTSVRMMSQEFGGFSKPSQNEDYNPPQKYTTTGDVVIVPVFSGSPSGNFEIKSNSTTVSEVMPVDAAPSRIRHTVRHGMNVSWPKAIDVRTLDDAQQVNWENQGWSIVTQRLNNTSRANFPFGYENSRIRVMTQNEDEAGGEKSPLS